MKNMGEQLRSQKKPEQMDLDFSSGAEEKVDMRKLKDVPEEEWDVLRQEIIRRRQEGEDLTPLLSELELFDREESKIGSWETGF